MEMEDVQRKVWNVIEYLVNVKWWEQIVDNVFVENVKEEEMKYEMSVIDRKCKFQGNEFFEGSIWFVQKNPEDGEERGNNGKLKEKNSSKPLYIQSKLKLKNPRQK